MVVHGGGRAIDAELARARQRAEAIVDGLRITDAATLDAVVAVLGGTINTRLVARLVAAGARAVGLTGADAALGAWRREPRRMSPRAGAQVDLGLVGEPDGRRRSGVVIDLLAGGYVPVVASIGVSRDGGLLNVNADTIAAHLAAGIGATRADHRRRHGGRARRGRRDDPGAALDGEAERDDRRTARRRPAWSRSWAPAATALDGGVATVSIVDGRARKRFSRDGHANRLATRT